MERLTGNIAVLSLTNTIGITIQIDDDCENVRYQLNNRELLEEIKTAPIIWIEGENEEEEFKAGFITEFGSTYELEEFLRVDFN